MDVNSSRALRAPITSGRPPSSGRQWSCPDALYKRQSLRAKRLSPETTAPVTAARTTATPAPMSTSPTPVTATPAPTPSTPAAATTPASATAPASAAASATATAAAPFHLFGIEAVNVVLGSDCGFCALIGRRGKARVWRNRKQGHGIRHCSKSNSTCNKSKSEFQKIPAFHDPIPFKLNGFAALN